MPFTSSEDRARRLDAIKRLIEMAKSRKAVRAHVMLLQYYIEGEPCPASALTVSPDYTPNLDETGEGFRCDAFFPDKILSPHALAVGQRVKSGAIQVRLEVKAEDIVAIIVTPELGPETILYAMS